MTRAHVRLLGPCFKTGRTGNRPIRHRPQADSGSRSRRTSAVSGHSRESPQIERSHETTVPPPASTKSSSVRRRANAFRVYNTEPLRDRPPSPEASDRRRTGHGVPPAESAPVDRAIRRAAPLADATTRRPPCRRVESDGRTLRSSPFASKRFHVLLNSLFKVLFNFPSRYLFAIGLVSVFSLRWSLPPALGCIIKQPDSEDVAGESVRRRRGLTPALAAPIRRTRTPDRHACASPKHHSSLRLESARFGAGLFPLHSPLLRESWLVSFPPLINMLKFSG